MIKDEIRKSIKELTELLLTDKIGNNAERIKCIDEIFTSRIIICTEELLKMKFIEDTVKNFKITISTCIPDDEYRMNKSGQVEFISKNFVFTKDLSYAEKALHMNNIKFGSKIQIMDPFCNFEKMEHKKGSILINIPEIIFSLIKTHNKGNQAELYILLPQYININNIESYEPEPLNISYSITLEDDKNEK